MSAKGFKRQCQECSTAFYDFNKRPIICPKCHTEIIGVTIPKLAPVEEKPAAVEEDQHEIESSDTADNIVSLDTMDDDEDDDDEDLMRVEDDIDLDSIDDLDDHLNDDA